MATNLLVTRDGWSATSLGDGKWSLSRTETIKVGQEYNILIPTYMEGTNTNAGNIILNFTVSDSQGSYVAQFTQPKFQTTNASYSNYDYYPFAGLVKIDNTEKYYCNPYISPWTSQRQGTISKNTTIDITYFLPFSQTFTNKTFKLKLDTAVKSGDGTAYYTGLGFRADGDTSKNIRTWSKYNRSDNSNKNYNITTYEITFNLLTDTSLSFPSFTTTPDFTFNGVEHSVSITNAPTNVLATLLSGSIFSAINAGDYSIKYTPNTGYVWDYLVQGTPGTCSETNQNIEGTKWVQSVLSILKNPNTSSVYYSGNIDGGYGSLTKSAVQAFQSNNNLTVDGSVGQLTLSKLQDKFNSEALYGVFELNWSIEPFSLQNKTGSQLIEGYNTQFIWQGQGVLIRPQIEDIVLTNDYKFLEGHITTTDFGSNDTVGENAGTYKIGPKSGDTNVAQNYKSSQITFSIVEKKLSKLFIKTSSGWKLAEKLYIKTLDGWKEASDIFIRTSDNNWK